MFLLAFVERLDAGGETEAGLVDDVDGLVERVETHHAEHGAEQLAQVRGRAGEDAPFHAGCDEVRVVVAGTRLDEPLLAGLKFFDARF